MACRFSNHNPARAESRAHKPRSPQRFLTRTLGLFLLVLLNPVARFSYASTINPDYLPEWANVQPSHIITHEYDAGLTVEQNGDALMSAIAALAPGDLLLIGAGEYDLGANTVFDIALHGSATKPIWIQAAANGTPVIHRLGTTNSVFNFVSPAAYVALEGLSITGGTIGVRIQSASQLWFHQNQIYNTGGGIKARYGNTDHVYVTYNDIHDTNLNEYGEAVVVGGPLGGQHAHDWVVAHNHIHHTQNTMQGDGIEINRDSYGNRVVENYVHHAGAHFPCIIFDRNGDPNNPNVPQPVPLNILEKNIVHNCGDNGIQAQDGGALVRDNLIVGPVGNKLFDSTHSEATLQNLEVVHNTMLDVNDSYGAGLWGWKGQPGLIFANNVVYVNPFPNVDGYALALPAQNAGGTLERNVIFYGTKNPFKNPPSTLSPTAYAIGHGLTDFVNVPAWFQEFPEAASVDEALQTAQKYRPALTGVIIGSADPNYLVEEDLVGHALRDPYEAGALEAEFCGDALVQSVEACDDGNAVSGDGCSATCVVEFCGDGITQPGLGETCDGGPSCSKGCYFYSATRHGTVKVPPPPPTGPTIQFYGTSTPSCVGSISIGVGPSAQTGSGLVAITALGAPPKSAGFLLLSTASATKPIKGATVLVDLSANAAHLAIPVTSTQSGYAEFPVNPATVLPAGLAVFAQYVFSNASCSETTTWSASNGLSIVQP